MWIRRLTLTNFRGFASLDLDLDRPLTVLVGVNGSGKSSVLRALAIPQSKILSVINRRHGLPGHWASGHDVRLGSTGAEIVCHMRQAAYNFAFRVWWEVDERFWDGAFHACDSLTVLEQPGALYLFLADTGRRMETAEVPMPGTRGGASEEHYDSDEENEIARKASEDKGAIAPIAGYGRLVEWFKEREDVENERRVQKRDLDLQDPQLRAVREAVAALMPGFTNLRIERDPSPVMVVTKGDVELRLDQLSDGERNLIALAGDLARRLVIANPEHPSPRETEAVILIDEVEQHLHPALQRKVIPSLQRAFPKAQLIVTTHSPQVLSSVPASSVVVLDHFEALSVSAPTQGRDTNAILREVFGVSERPEEEVARIRAIAGLIDEARLDEARAALLTLADTLSESDDDVQRLRTRLDFAEAGL